MERAVGTRELYDVYARPFEAAFRLAGLATIMPSYSEFDGVPISASRAVLTDLLRGRMGFTGTTVSDYVAVGFLHTRQKVARTPEEAGALALAGGMDVETPAVYGYGQVLAKAVRDGKVSESLLDRSVRRVLRDKFALGLFDNPYVTEDPARIRAIASEGADLSRRLAAESVTLLKNEKGLLPLSRVELHDLGAAPLARVGDGERHPRFAADVDAVGGQLQLAVLERGVAEAVAEWEQRRRRHVEIALVDVLLGPSVAAAPFLGVVDRHLPHVTRHRERQFSSGVGDAEHGVGERDRLVRPTVVIGEHRRQLVDHGREGIAVISMGGPYAYRRRSRLSCR